MHNISAKRSLFSLVNLTGISLSCPANISTSDQRCFNIVDQSWNNVDPTLKMKQNPTSDFQRCTMLIQRQCPTLKQCRNNVTQRWYNVDTTLLNLTLTLVKPILNPIGPVTIVDCVIVIHVKYMNSCYSAKSESIFLLYINNWTTNKISKIFLIVVDVVIHNVGNNGDIHRSWKCCMQNFKTSLKNTKT